MTVSAFANILSNSRLICNIRAFRHVPFLVVLPLRVPASEVLGSRRVVTAAGRNQETGVAARRCSKGAAHEPYIAAIPACPYGQHVGLFRGP